MLKTAVRTIAGFFTTLSGLLILFDPNCNTLSFDSEGGGRVIRPVCSFDSSGAIPGWLGGILILAFGLAILPWQKFSKLFENLDSAVNGFSYKKEASTKSVQHALDDLSESELKALPKPMLGSGYPKVKGWNSDPSGKFHERYWDGESWTLQIRDRDWRKQAKTSKSSIPKIGNQQVPPPLKPIDPVTPSAVNAPIASFQNLTTELATLSDLFSKGHLSEEEFSNAKKRILG